MNEDYVAGFMAKAAELGVAPEELAKTAARGDQLMKLINTMSGRMAKTPETYKNIPGMMHPGPRYLEDLKSQAGKLSWEDLIPAASPSGLRRIGGEHSRSRINSLANQMRDVRSVNRRAITGPAREQHARLQGTLRATRSSEQQIRDLIRAVDG